MNSLVPELHPDKNGKLVTRHVKGDTGSQLGSKSIPTPQLTPAPSPSEKALELSNELSNYIENVMNEHEEAWEDGEPNDDEYFIEYDPNSLLSPGDTAEAVLALPQRTIEQISQKLDVDFKDDYVVGVLHALEDEAPSITFEYLTYFYDTIDDITETDMSSKGIASYAAIKDMVSRLKELSYLGYQMPENIFEATPEEVYLATTLNLMWEEMYDGAIGATNLAAMKLIIDNPERAEEISEYIYRRGDNVKGIEEMLRSYPAVSNGSL